MDETLGKSLSNSIIGVAGCGAMGLPMAKALARAGFMVRGFDIRPIAEFGDFEAHMISSAEEFSSAVDVVISVVRDQKQTLDLYFDDQAIFSFSDHPKACLLASTVSPSFVSQISTRLPRDVQFFEIPMSGAPIAAEEERLTFMIGADEETASSYRPLIDAMGRELHFLGGLAKGMACKVLNNFVAASSIVAVRQVLSDAGKLNIPANQLLEVMKSSSGSTWFGDNFDAIDWANENYDEANTIGIVEKDVNSLLVELESLDLDDQTKLFIETVRDRLSTLPRSPKV